jgi:nucleoside-triphosphatase
MKTVFLLTGLPGSGKTSLIKQVLSTSTVQCGGFFTEEIRLQGVRQGFRLVTLDGQSLVLAHTGYKSPHHVSRYGVDIDGLDNVGVAALQQSLRQYPMIVIDEIGKMELFSEKFKTAVLEAIESGVKVLGTIMYKPDPWADLIKQNSRVRLFTLTRQNQPAALKEIQSWIEEKPLT